MKPQLAIFVCETFAPEVSATIKQEGYKDVVVEVIPLQCGCPHMSTKNILNHIELASSHSTHTHYMGSSCFQIQKEASQLPANLSFTALSQCFDIIIPSQLTYSLIQQEYYLISSGWLPSFKEQIRCWGFDEITARHFFGETAKKLLYVDTGLCHDADALLTDLSDFVGLPYETMKIGLSHCKLLIQGVVLAWRVNQEREETRNQLMRITRESAEYSMAFQQISLLAQISEEERIMQKIAEMVLLLFHPSKIVYQRQSENGDAPPQELFSDESVSTSENPGSASFTITLEANNRNIGRINIINIAFPEYLESYQKLSPILGKIFGLVLSNAEKYATILENEKKLQINATQLEELNATKDKFFSIIAHDLRSPFHSLLGFINLFLDDYHEFSDAERRDFVQRIQGISKNTYRLLENLLDWAGSQSGTYELKPVEVSLRQLILDNIRIFEPAASQKNIRLQLKEKPDLLVLADLYSLDAVIRNLINNALKFTSRGGKVSIEFSKKDPFAICTITDTGIGIPQALVDQLFQIGAQVRRPGTSNETGTGLGLILCKEYIVMNGGEIWVESKEGTGTSFSISVPLFDSPGNLDK